MWEGRDRNRCWSDPLMKWSCRGRGVFNAPGHDCSSSWSNRSSGLWHAKPGLIWTHNKKIQVELDSGFVILWRKCELCLLVQQLPEYCEWLSGEGFMVTKVFWAFCLFWFVFGTMLHCYVVARVLSVISRLS